MSRILIESTGKIVRQDPKGWRTVAPRGPIFDIPIGHEIVVPAASHPDYDLLARLI